MTYTEALKLFDGNASELKRALRASRQVMYLFREKLKQGKDPELSWARQLSLEVYLDKQLNRFSAIREAYDNLNKGE